MGAVQKPASLGVLAENKIPKKTECRVIPRCSVVRENATGLFAAFFMNRGGGDIRRLCRQSNPKSIYFAPMAPISTPLGQSTDNDRLASLRPSRGFIYNPAPPVLHPLGICGPINLLHL